MARKPVRKEIAFYEQNPVDCHVLHQLQNMAEGSGMSVAEVIKKIVVVFTPAAAMSDYIDVARLQQSAIAALVNGSPQTQQAIASQPMAMAQTTAQFEPIQGL